MSGGRSWLAVPLVVVAVAVAACTSSPSDAGGVDRDGRIGLDERAERDPALHGRDLGLGDVGGGAVDPVAFTTDIETQIEPCSPTSPRSTVPC